MYYYLAYIGEYLESRVRGLYPAFSVKHTLRLFINHGKVEYISFLVKRGERYYYEGIHVGV